jgi:hypothetical protein
MTGFRIEIDAKAMAEQGYRGLHWWQRLWVRLLGKEKVLAEAADLIAGPPSK